MPGRERSQGIRAGPALVLAMVLVTGLLAGVLATGLASPAEVPRSVTAYATLGVSFSYSPNTISVNSQTQGMYAISGGTQPFTIWVNNTPPGCGPQTNPFTTSNASGQFTCTPTMSGTYNVMVEVHDGAGNQGSGGATLTVNSNTGGNGNGSGSGNNSGSGLQLPAGLMSTLVLFGAVFVGAIVAMAAGVIATAVLVSRGLRRLNETMKKTEEPPSSGKPPN